MRRTLPSVDAVHRRRELRFRSRARASRDGHDVIAVAELDAGIEDDVVIARALGERRVLLTEDKDFGQIVFASQRPAPGVLFIRFPAGARSGLAAAVLAFVQKNESALADSFSTLQPGRARISRLPT